MRLEADLQRRTLALRYHFASGGVVSFTATPAGTAQTSELFAVGGRGLPLGRYCLLVHLDGQLVHAGDCFDLCSCPSCPP